MKLNIIDRKIRHFIGRSVHTYTMLEEGDRILVAVSGGKDSLTLLWYFLDHLKRSPIKYEIVAVHLEMGFFPQGIVRLENYFRTLNIPYHVESTTIGKDAHSPGNTVNPCFLCSRNRRKRLFELADEFQCNKLAFGHNRDDFVETFLLNMLFSGQISTIKPKQDLFNQKLAIIRPLVLVSSAIVSDFSISKNFPVFINNCPSSNNSKRSEIRNFFGLFEGKEELIKANIFHSMQNIREEYLF